MIFALIRYIPSAIVDLIADALAFILAPLAAMFIARIDGREHIHPFWSWITTHDAPIDAGRVDGYFQVPDNALGRYWARVKWIWRNPAYQVSHWLGYDQRGVTTAPDRFKDDRWDTGEPNRAFWRVVNRRGQVAFLYQRQMHWWRFTLEMQFGWKLYRRDPDQRCMLAFRISPFKKY